MSWEIGEAEVVAADEFDLFVFTLAAIALGAVGAVDALVAWLVEQAHCRADQLLQALASDDGLVNDGIAVAHGTRRVQAAVVGGTGDDSIVTRGTGLDLDLQELDALFEVGAVTSHRIELMLHEHLLLAVGYYCLEVEAVEKSVEAADLAVKVIVHVPATDGFFLMLWVVLFLSYW